MIRNLEKHLIRAGLDLTETIVDGDRMTIVVDGWPDTQTLLVSKALPVVEKFPDGAAATEAGDAALCRALDEAGAWA